MHTVAVTACPFHVCSFLLADLHKPDLVCLSETWIKPTTTSTEQINCTPPGYIFISTPRNFTKNSSSTGGGTSFVSQALTQPHWKLFLVGGKEVQMFC